MHRDGDIEVARGACCHDAIVCSGRAEADVAMTRVWLRATGGRRRRGSPLSGRWRCPIGATKSYNNTIAARTIDLSGKDEVSSSAR